MDAEDISYQILREITDGFSEERKLGQGAFGVVYKVKLGRLAFSLWTNKYILNKSAQHNNASALKQYMVLYK